MVEQAHGCVAAGREVAGFDLIDLAAKIGGLALMPENADRMSRFEAASGIVASMRPCSDWTPKIGPERFDKWLNGPSGPLSLGLNEEDPYTDLFTESVAFYGGPFTVFPGVMEDSVYILRHICEGIFKAPLSFDVDCRSQANHLVSAVLKVSHEIAVRSRLGRNTKSIPTTGQPVRIPGAEVHNSLAAAVRFSKEDLIRLVGPSFDALQALIVTLGESSGRALDPTNPPTLARPIVRWNNDFVVIAPGHLMAALCHEMLALIVRGGQEGDFNTVYRWTVFRNVVRSLGAFGNRPTGVVLPDGGQLPMQAGLFTLDRDKLLHCMLITDELEEFQPGVVFGEWNHHGLEDALEHRVGEIDSHISKWSNPPRETLHLVLFQGVGRSHIVSLGEPIEPVHSTVVTLSASGLETVSLLECGNQLALRQYARAQDSLHRHASVITTGDLDKFAIYRAKGHGFYLSDGPRPTTVFIAPGEGGKLHEEAKLRMDRHLVSSYRSGELIEVFRIDEDVPIYAPLPNPGERHRRIALVVEGYDVPVWVVAGELPDSDEYSDVNRTHVEMIAYWIWQFTPALRNIIDSLSDLVENTLVVEIVALPGRGWFEHLDGERESDTCTVSFNSDAIIRLEIGPGFATRFSTSDNSAERLVVREILTGLHQLHRSLVGAGQSHLIRRKCCSQSPGVK